MLGTTRQGAAGGQGGDFARSIRPAWITLISTLVLAGCGGGSGDSTAPAPSSQDLANAHFASLSSTVEVPGNRVKLQWYDAFYPAASRYQIEKQNADGSWSVIDAVLGGYAPQQHLQWTGSLDAPTTFRVDAVLPDYSVPLATAVDSNSPTVLTATPPDPIPTLQIDQPQPLARAANVTLLNADSAQYVTYYMDGVEFSANFATASVVLSPHYVAGIHTLSANLSVDSSHLVTVATPVEISVGKVAAQMLLRQRPGQLDAYVIATSDSALVSATLTEDSVAVAPLTALNACAPPPCAPGQAFNAFLFSIDIGKLPASHYISGQVTDAAGNVASAYANVTIPGPSTATLTAPVDGASASGVLHLSGSYSSGTTGPLELLVTLSGLQVYDTTVANPGTVVPLDAEVNLTGVAPGPHTLGVYVRVGNSAYTQAASVVVNVGQ